MTDEKKPRKPRGPNKTFQQRLEIKHRQLEVAEKRAAREADKANALKAEIDQMIDTERAKHEAALSALAEPEWVIPAGTALKIPEGAK